MRDRATARLASNPMTTSKHRDQQPRRDRATPGPEARHVRDRDRHRPQSDQDKPHALPLGQADHQERIGQADEDQHASGRAVEEDRRQEEEEDRAELVRKAVESVGLERQGHERGQQVE